MQRRSGFMMISKRSLLPVLESLKVIRGFHNLRISKCCTYGKKLTLNLDSKVIEAAKKYSEKKGFSKLVEDYFKKITRGNQPKKNSKNSLMSLKGILGKVPADFDYKNNAGRISR